MILQCTHNIFDPKSSHSGLLNSCCGFADQAIGETHSFFADLRCVLKFLLSRVPELYVNR